MSTKVKTDSDNADRSKLVEAANFRAHWRQSPEARKAVVGLSVLVAGCVLSTILGAAIGWQLTEDKQQQGYTTAIGAGVGLLLSLYFGVLAFNFFRRAQMRAFSDRYLLAEAKRSWMRRRRILVMRVQRISPRCGE